MFFRFKRYPSQKAVLARPLPPGRLGVLYTTCANRGAQYGLTTTNQCPSQPTKGNSCYATNEPAEVRHDNTSDALPWSDGRRGTGEGQYVDGPRPSG